MKKLFKYGLKLWSINTESYRKEAIRLYKEGLFDFIELYTVPGSLDTLSEWKKLDMPFIIHGPHYAHGMNFANKNNFEKNMKLYEETKTFADSLNAEHIIFHPGTGGFIRETASQVNQIDDERILIENKPYKALPVMKVDFCTGSTPEEIRHLQRRTKAGFCLDIGHAIAAANSFKMDFMKYTEKFIELTPQMYHLSDTDIEAETDYHYNFGKGNMDLEKIIRLIPENSSVTIETKKASSENLDDFIEDIEVLTDTSSKILAKK